MIAGPTASGKSAVALALSRLVPSTIINADASQVYADLRILSARPSDAEMREAPHRLFGHIDGAESCSAARWASEAKASIAASRAKWRLPILVGGTGLYLRTLLNGIAPVPDIDPDIRAQVRAMPLPLALGELVELDPVAAQKLAPNDSTRIARALEVIRSTGRTLADWQRERTGGIEDQVRAVGAVLLPPRDWIHARCDARFEDMLDAGGIDEVRTLLARGLDPALPVMRAIGVPQIAAFLADPSERESQIAAAKAATRQYAKRQYTWFRHQPPADWQRHTQQLDDEMINEIAILCRDMALTP